MTSIRHPREGTQEYSIVDQAFNSIRIKIDTTALSATNRDLVSILQMRGPNKKDTWAGPETIKTLKFRTVSKSG